MVLFLSVEKYPSFIRLSVIIPKSSYFELIGGSSRTGVSYVESEKWEKKIDDYTIDLKRSLYDHTEVGAPPIKTKYGWLSVYSYIQNYFPSPNGFDKVFGIEAVLLDLKDPRKIVGRTSGPIIVPEES